MQKLNELSRFITWKLIDGKKIPFGLDSKPGIEATAGTYEEASKVAKRLDGTSGVGLILKDLPVAFIDIDGYDTAFLVQQNLLRLFSGKAYIERSQSGEGFHIIARVDQKAEYTTIKTERFEIYLEDRFCALTGRTQNDSLALEDVLSVDCSVLFKKVHRALKLIIKTDELIDSLRRGVAEKYDSPSEFDFALVRTALKYTSDKDTIHGVLMLSESDEIRRKHHGENDKTHREDYVYATIKSITKQWDKFLVEDHFNFDEWNRDNLGDLFGKPIVRRRAFTVVRSLTGVGKGHFVLSILASLFGGAHTLGAVSRPGSYTLLYFDTEMGRDLTSKMKDMFFRKVQRDIGHAAVFASVQDAKVPERLQAINKLTQDIKPDVVVLDGLRDLLHNFNDTDQTYRLIQELEHLALSNNCAIVGTIHVNPGDGVTKSRGHLGTEIEQKAFTVIHIERDEEDPELLIVSHVKGRTGLFDPYKIRFNNESGFLTLPKVPF